MNVILDNEEHTDEELKELLLRMAAAADTIQSITLRTVYLGDKSATIIATLLRRSSTIEKLDLAFNRVSAKGFAQIARALAVNTSLRVLSMWGNAVAVSEEALAIDKFFSDAIAINPRRPADSVWRLYSDREEVNDYTRLRPMV